MNVVGVLQKWGPAVAGVVAVLWIGCDYARTRQKVVSLCNSAVELTPEQVTARALREGMQTYPFKDPNRGMLVAHRPALPIPMSFMCEVWISENRVSSARYFED